MGQAAGREEKQLGSTVLDRILEARRRRIAQARARVPLRDVERAAEARVDLRDFAGAISGGGLSVIAELKQASPSRGVLRDEYSPQAIARGYEAAGAAALSVLTEEDYFKGSLDDLRAVRLASTLPILRKDFVFEPYQVYESAAAGADAVLLIVSPLTDEELRQLVELAARLKLAALVEAHTEEELSRALHAGARIIGVNNRNLQTLEVDLETSFRLRPKIPTDCLSVSESGISSVGDLRRLSAAGFDAVLIGERCMTAPDPGKELADLLSLFSEAARSATGR